MSYIDVSEALVKMSMDEELLKYILKNRDSWEVFGKMNSMLYRRQLFTMMEKAKLNAEQMFMVFFMFSVIKNKDRVMKSMEAMSAEDKAKEWFSPVMSFINTNMTQYVSDVTKSRKFPAVNVPNCMPGLDILIWTLITHPNKRTLWNLAQRTTFSQLDLAEDVQEFAKAGYTEYWNNVVKSTKNPDAKTQNLPVPEFREEYYANSVNDRYRLVDINLKEIEPLDISVGYKEAEVVAYIKSIDPLREFVESEAELTAELEAELV
jgi:hypothetical protein